MVSEDSSQPVSVMCADDFYVHVAGFVRELSNAGYASNTIGGYLWVVRHIGAWIANVHIELASLDEAAIERFWQHFPACRCSGRVPMNAKPTRSRKFQAYIEYRSRCFLKYMRAKGVVPDKASTGPRDPPIFKDFRTWMLRHRGVKATSVERHRLPILRLVTALGADPGNYTTEALRRFVIHELQARKIQKPTGLTSAIRMFLRWAASMGMCPATLVNAIPRVAHWRLASLPKYLEGADVERLIAACDVSTKAGIRDRAILLLLARLGLRAGDIIELRVDDIDWENARVRVVGKARQEARLPLPQDVGDAILAYLETARPPSSSAKLFLRAFAPVGPLSPTGIVAMIVSRAMQRAGVTRLAPNHGGARVLRHSAATAMLRQGASLQDVGKLLRHQSLDTTAIYAKVDVETLTRIAQAWPEATPC